MSAGKKPPKQKQLGVSRRTPRDTERLLILGIVEEYRQQIIENLKVDLPGRTDEEYRIFADATIRSADHRKMLQSHVDNKIKELNVQEIVSGVVDEVGKEIVRTNGFWRQFNTNLGAGLVGSGIAAGIAWVVGKVI